MKKITFLLLASFLLFSCEKPEIEDPQGSVTPPTTPPTVVKVDFTAAVSNATVYNGTDGKITITVTSGTAPYTYQLGTGTAQTTNVFSGLTAGSYNVTVIDSKSQTLSKTAEITQPTEVILPLAFTLTSINVSAWGLSDGSITTNVTSGMPPYSYSLSNGLTNSTGIFTNLIAGNYTVTVTDSKQQTGNKSIEITQPAKPQPVPIYMISSVTSKTEVSGSLNLNFMQVKNSFTISFWYNTPTTQLNKNNPTYTTAQLLSTDHSDNVTGESNTIIEINKVKMQYVRKDLNNVVTLNSTIAWSGLHHMVVLYDGSNMKMYLDNVLINTVSSNTDLHFNKLYLGGSYANETYNYNGTISKVKFYNGALTPEEIDYLYKN